MISRLMLALAFVLSVIAASAPPVNATSEADQFRAILDQVAAASDPYAAARQLSPRDQALLVRGLRGVKVTATTETQPAAKWSGSGKLAALSLAGFCPDATGMTYTMTNIYGMVLWQYRLEVYWCWDGSYVTSASFNRFPQNVALFWQFVSHIGLSTSGGVGQTFYRVWTQGFFQLCFPYCGVQNVYPWIQITVYGSGGSSASKGS